MKKPMKPAALVDQRNALNLYLEALLNEVVEDEEDQPVVEPLPQALLSPEPAEIDSTSEQGIQTTSSTAPVVEFVSPNEDSLSPIQNNESDKPPEIPQWALPRCQVLTFTLGTMQMAAPLEKLNGIIPFPERLTALPGQSPWFLGLARNRNQNVQVVDLASIIQPHARYGSKSPAPETTEQYLLLIGDGQWGIVCNRISTVLTLEPQQVQWGRSPHVDYILGTVIDKMHSVLCIDTLLERLASGRLV